VEEVVAWMWIGVEDVVVEVGAIEEAMDRLRPAAAQVLWSSPGSGDRSGLGFLFF
jgi:hypothetical protein